MNLDSKLDDASIRQRFFSVLEDEFRRGASVQKLTELSQERGVWEGVEEQLARLGMQEKIKGYIRSAKEGGRRKFHSLPARDADGNEIQIYKDVAFLELEDYRILLAKYEKRIDEHMVVYLDLVHQAKERYGYQHPLPFAAQAYVDAVTSNAVDESIAA